ncbi:MAG: DUF3137 domain-containing protein [Bacillota bacterium]
MQEKIHAFQKRKRVVESTIILGGLSMIVAAALFVFAVAPTELIVALLVVGAVTLFFGYSAYTSIQDDFKEKVLKDILEESVENGSYKPQMGLGPTQVYQGECLSQADHMKTEDFLSGAIDGVSFISSDVVLANYQTVSTGKSVAQVLTPYFTGRVFSFDFNKAFKGRVFVMEKGKPVTQYKTETVELESHAFNETFKTYATDAHTAFYVLTPQVIQALLKIEKNHPGDLSFSFIGTKLHIAINNQIDTFELSMFRPLNEEAIRAFTDDLDILRDVVRSLKLNRSIFKD